MPEKFGVDYWRARAAEVRELAAQIDDDEAKEQLLWIAERYDELARRALAQRRNGC